MSEAPSSKNSSPRFKTAAGGLKQAFAHAAERVTVREETRRGGAVKEKEHEGAGEGEEGGDGGERQTEGMGRGEAGGEVEGVGQGRALMPGKALVKRMQDVSKQFFRGYMSYTRERITWLPCVI